MKQAVVYRAYAAGDVALYVGMTTQLRTREKAHRSTAAWVDQIVRVELDGPFPWVIAGAVERTYIRLLQPRHNLRKLREPSSEMAVVSVRAKEAKHRRFREIAERSGRTWAAQLRLLIDRSIEDFESAGEQAA